MEEVRGGKYLLLIDDLVWKYFHNWVPERRFVGILDQQERHTIRLIKSAPHSGTYGKKRNAQHRDRGAANRRKRKAHHREPSSSFPRALVSDSHDKQGT